MDPFETGADVHFPDVDWREELDDEDPDDEEIETPADVVAVLGFDPREAEEPEPMALESPPQPKRTVRRIQHGRDERGQFTEIVEEEV